MKKRTIKHLSLGKTKISTLATTGIAGGLLPTTLQSNYCPVNPLPDPIKHTDNPAVCTSRSCNSACVIC